MSKLCDACKRLGIFQESQTGALPQFVLDPAHCKHHETVKDLIKSAESGCDFCLCVWKDLKQESRYTLGLVSNEELVRQLGAGAICLEAKHQSERFLLSFSIHVLSHHDDGPRSTHALDYPIVHSGESDKLEGVVASPKTLETCGIIGKPKSAGHRT